MEAPEKIYLTPLECMAASCQPQKDNTVEYTRTDAFIEKACEFIRKMVDIPHNIECKDGQPLVDDYIKYAEERLKVAEKVVNDFKNYMKGE